jgi:hypothetical protein
MADSSTFNLEWNPANWITVLLMVAIGYAVIGFLTRLYQNRATGAAS